MKIAIHHKKGSFSEQWIAYCEMKGITYKLINCHSSDIIKQLEDCDALMWHFSQNNPKVFLFAKQLIYSVEASGRKVFPDFNTVWHFDDKVGQKYLLESVGAPLAQTWVFYDKKDAFQWANSSSYPKVFKLRGGSGSQNVRLVQSRKQAFTLIRKAFKQGFPQYDPLGSLKERYRLFRLGKTNIRDLLEGIARFFVPPLYSRSKGRERGYILFQEFIAGNRYDIRVVVIGNKAFAIKRIVRDNDFRASGSGKIFYEKELFSEDIIELSFRVAEILHTQCVAFDYIYDNVTPLIVEISYGFSPQGYLNCPGYWVKDLTWHEGRFNPYGWMVENLVKVSATRDNNVILL